MQGPCATDPLAARLGASLWRRHMAYDARAEIAEIDRIIATQSGAWRAPIAPSCVTDAPVFVCGLPRTGTTLVERIIASHSAADSVGETNVFPVEASRALRAWNASGAPDFNAIGEQYISPVKNVFAPQKSRFALLVNDLDRVRTRLAAGGKWIRTVGPAVKKGSPRPQRGSAPHRERHHRRHCADVLRRVNHSFSPVPWTR